MASRLEVWLSKLHAWLNEPPKVFQSPEKSSTIASTNKPNPPKEAAMAKFGTKSRERLATCHPDLQRLFNEVIKGYDCSILEGHRSNERQEELYSQGKSKVRAGKSKHNAIPSNAVDVAPYPIDWNDKIRFYHFVGYVKGVASQMGINIRCGADWDSDNDLHDQTFFDLPHFELK